ncbi:hypothetical protein [Caballeronia telluris]|uniref:Uncharacterized protein n=1 Tax=Caballeronia telluris TaxID=326475 RepID=A0A158G234_9BURK|nr:hypothetical protein [Caballeronia telluris]SAL26164.1 hypothetical protein AWB66_01516 [Caballeronia telluris]
MSEIANKRVLMERAQALIKASEPTLDQLGGVAEALAQVATDLIGADCRIVIKVDQKALQVAIERNERVRGAA